jgi:hypothetical protein
MLQSKPMKTKSKSEFRQFFTAFIECALWSSLDEYSERGGRPLDENYSRDDIAFSSALSMARECRDFLRANATDLEIYYEARDFGGSHSGYAMAGHDFWLTKNGHGAGFWDRGLGDLGRRLSENAKVYGSTDLYLGDDGKIYAS